MSIILIGKRFTICDLGVPCQSMWIIQIHVMVIEYVKIYDIAQWNTPKVSHKVNLFAEQYWCTIKVLLSAMVTIVPVWCLNKTRPKNICRDNSILWLQKNKLLHATVNFSNINCEAIRARIALKLGSLLSFTIRNALKQSSICGEKIQIEGRLHWRSHNIPNFNRTKAKCVLLPPSRAMELIRVNCVFEID